VDRAPLPRLPTPRRAPEPPPEPAPQRRGWLGVPPRRRPVAHPTSCAPLSPKFPPYRPQIAQNVDARAPNKPRRRLSNDRGRACGLGLFLAQFNGNALQGGNLGGREGLGASSASNGKSVLPGGAAGSLVPARAPISLRPRATPYPTFSCTQVFRPRDSGFFFLPCTARPSLS